MAEYRCVNGHDLCNTMLPSKDCPYCERVSKPSARVEADNMSENIDTSDIPEADEEFFRKARLVMPKGDPYPGGAAQHTRIAEIFRELSRLYQAANRLEEAEEAHQHACWHEAQADLLSAGMLAQYQR